MDLEEYRRLQLEAVSGHGGTSEWEIIKVTSWLVFATLGWRVMGRARYPPGSARQFLLEFALLIVPQIVLFCFPQWTRWMVVSVLVPSILLCKRVSPSKKSTARRVPRAFLTNTRAAIMIMCVIGILAVDFPSIFPRRFAKTETVGTSLMDVGVGCVVVSMGMMASRNYGGKPPSLWITMKSTVPLLALGLIRMALVKGISYQEHVSEYGVHWNFFITLGLLPLMLFMLFRILCVPPRYSFAVGVLMGVVYQVVLDHTSLGSFLLAELSRSEGSSFFVMNKEGIVSLVGYLSLCLMSSAVGTDIMSDSSDSEIIQRVGLKLISLISGYVLLKYKFDILPSRRLMNFTFAMGSLALTIIQMLGFFLVEVLANDAANEVSLISASANVMTGLINLTCYTLMQPPTLSLAILITYMFILCSLFVLLYLGGTRLRL